MHRISTSTSQIPNCLICDNPLDKKNSKILNCCQNIIHNTCLAKNVKGGGLDCCFCRSPITNIPLELKVEGVMRKAFNQQKNFDDGELSLLVRSMYNPEDQEIPPRDQMDIFLPGILYSTAPLSYKRQLWQEFAKQIENPASHSHPIDVPANLSPQARITAQKKHLENTFDDWIEDNYELIHDFLKKDPFPISQNILTATARALLEIPIPDESKRIAWDAFWEHERRNPENRAVIDEFTANSSTLFPYLSDSYGGWIEVKKANSSTRK